MNIVSALLSGTAVVALAGSTQIASAPVSQPPFKLTATIQDLMQTQIEPAANVIWESVSTVTTAAGVEEHQPRTAEDWENLRRHAITLIESANLLVIDGRRVVHDGKQVEDVDVKGVLAADRIQTAIAEDRSGFIEHAHAFHAAGLQALAAIEARDPTRVIEAGGHLEGACEGCHQKFWYPEAQEPGIPSSSP
jgi:hypothetical protein